MQKINPIKSLLVTASLLALTATTQGAFTPIPINPASFNHDVVVEATAPRTLSDALTATVDGGTNKTGNTLYEKGYNPAAPTTGVPTAGSLVTNTAGDHVFQMPPDYHVNNVLMVGHNAGGRTALIPTGTLTFTTPAQYSGLSFLATAGNGPVNVAYVIHYADNSEDSGTFSVIDWFNAAPNVFNSAGRVSVDGGVQNVNGSPAGAVFSADIACNPANSISRIDFSYAGSGGNGNTNNNGRALIFAVSGSANMVNYFPIAVTGFNQDAVVEADGPQTTGTGVASAGTLTNNVTATMDGGTSKANNVWYEKGFYAAYPNSGLPAAGSTLTSATLKATYTMPPSYTANNAILLASNVTTATISLTGATANGALSILCASANGDIILPCVITHQDGSSETNALFVPDWFNRVLPQSYLAFGRVNPNNRTINNTQDRFINPFIPTKPLVPFSLDVRGLGFPVPRLFDSVLTLSNNASPVTSISLTFTNPATTGNRVAAIFAVSGSPADSIEPIFGYRGSATPGQPANAVLNDVTRVKLFEGTNIVLAVTNIAGTAPISYQWKKAPRGGGLLDVNYSFDYSTFANIVDGGRVSGATSSVLVISNATVLDSADYLVVASNSSGSTTSYVATVMMLTTNQSILVGKPAGDQVASYTSDASTAGESIDHVIDRIAQKWLSCGLNSPSTGNQILPFVGPIGYIVTPVSGSTIVTALRFYSANDSSGRDPYDYGLEGSNDGANWTQITGGILKGTLSLPTARNGTGAATLNPLTMSMTEVNFANSTGYKSYRVTLTNNCNPYGDALLQIGEIDMLGTLVPNPPVWVRQPEPTVKVFAGASPTFTAVAASYPAPKYQWYKNGSTLIAGATSTTYVLPNASAADNAVYTCMASNTFGQITSSGAVLTVVPAPTQSYPTAVLTDSPIGYWRLDDGPDDAGGNNGKVAFDYRGGHNGSYNATQLGVAGYNPVSDPDTAAEFGVYGTEDSYVADIKDVDFSRATNAPSGNGFSIEAWVYGTDQTTDAGIVSKGYNGILTPGTGTGTEQFVLDVVGGAPKKFRFLVRDVTGLGHLAQSPTSPLNAVPGWHHVVGVCDQPNGKLYLYVDGLFAANGDLPANLGILTQPLPVTIGARKANDLSTYNNQWIGRVDDVAVYNTALTASQVLAHYYAAQLPPTLTTQPTNVTTAENVLATFYSGAYGSGTLGYQWYLSDGTSPISAIAGQTSSNLTLTATAAMNGQNYQLVVTNNFGSTTSQVAQITVVSGPPVFYVDLPTSDTIAFGHIIRLQVVPHGTAPFTYQWTRNGSPITDNYRTFGASSNVLTIAYATAADNGNYQVTVVNGGGSAPSAVDAVTVITSAPAVPFSAAGTGWTMQGSTPPIMGNNRLELTSSLGSTARAAFNANKVNISSFNAVFTYQLTSAVGADGATFCIQNDTRGAAAVGGGGGGLAYSGIRPSVALGLNIYSPNTRGISLLQNGVLPIAGPSAYMSILPVPLGDNTDTIRVNLSYFNRLLKATFTDTVTAATFTTNMVVDIPATVLGTTAYVGFTGADGGTVSTQVITDFSLTPTPPSVTLQSTRVGNNLVLSWPASAGAFLRSSPSLSNPTWSNVNAQIQFVGELIQVTVPFADGALFYRLDVYP